MSRLERLLRRLLLPLDSFPAVRPRSRPVDLAALASSGVDVPSGVRMSLLFPDLLVLPPSGAHALPRLAPVAAILPRSADGAGDAC